MQNNRRSIVTFGSGLSHGVSRMMEKNLVGDVAFALHQWRTDQFLECVVNRVTPFLPGDILLEKTFRYLDEEKGAGILREQSEEHIAAWKYALVRGDILLLDNLVDINITLFSGVCEQFHNTKIQICHKSGMRDQLPFVRHEPLETAMTVRNNLEIFEFIKSVNQEISVWYLNYPYSPHLGDSKGKSDELKNLATEMWRAAPHIKQIPSLAIAPGMAKDLWHFKAVFFESLARYIFAVECGIFTHEGLQPVMAFDDFLPLLGRRETRSAPQDRVDEQEKSHIKKTEGFSRKRRETEGNQPWVLPPGKFLRSWLRCHKYLLLRHFAPETKFRKYLKSPARYWKDSKAWPGKLVYALFYQRNILRKERKEAYAGLCNTDLFDADYYRNCYKIGNAPPLRHYIRKGWKKGYNPSEYFSTADYLALNGDLLSASPECVPLWHFAKIGHKMARCVFAESAHFPTPERISAYWQRFPERIPRGVIYTCMTNGYDNLTIPFHIDDEWDYVYFTDDKDAANHGRIGVWQIKPLVNNAYDPSRINRFHKWQPHVLFPEYNCSVYLDANINILGPRLYQLADKGTKPLYLPLHFRSPGCVYDEFQWTLQSGRDDPEKMKLQLNLLRDMGLPEKYGLTENNIIIRSHHNRRVIKMMGECWDLIKAYSGRDQLALPYVLWRNGVGVNDVAFTPSPRLDIRNFGIYPHKKTERI